MELESINTAKKSLTFLCSDRNRLHFKNLIWIPQYSENRIRTYNKTWNWIRVRPKHLDPKSCIRDEDPDPVGSVDFMPAGSGSFTFFTGSGCTCNNGYKISFSSWTKYKPKSTNSSLKWWYIRSNFMPTYLKYKYIFFFIANLCRIWIFFHLSWIKIRRKKNILDPHPCPAPNLMLNGTFSRGSVESHPLTTVVRNTALRWYPSIIIVNILGASEITANLYCNCVHLYWEGCVICSIDLR